MMEKQHGTIWILLVLTGITLGGVIGWGIYMMNRSPEPVVEQSVVTDIPMVEQHISINGQQLSSSSHVPLSDGDYWYDAITGLYGFIGFAPIGIMPVGFDTAPLSQSVSAGDTGALLNGRELPSGELARYNTFLQQEMTTGTYHADSEGQLFDSSNALLGTVTFEPVREQSVSPFPQYPSSTVVPLETDHQNLF